MTILLNDDRRPVLFVGRGDWRGLSGSAEVSHSIDGAPPETVSADMVVNLVVMMPPEAVMQRLRNARMVDWTFPFGRFRTGVAGLGTALDFLAACRPDPAG